MVKDSNIASSSKTNRYYVSILSKSDNTSLIPILDLTTNDFMSIFISSLCYFCNISAIWDYMIPHLHSLSLYFNVPDIQSRLVPLKQLWKRTHRKSEETHTYTRFGN